MPQDGQIPISLAGDITQLSVTRASDNGFAAGDQVGIWAVNYEEDTPGTLQLKDNQATNVRFTFDGTSWSSDYDIYYKDKNTKVDIYGVYPYSSAISSIEEWPFEVQEDQSTVSAHGVMGGYEASDFLWAKREAVTPSPSTVQLLFQHKMSCVVVTLEEGTGFEAGEFAGLSQSVLINNVKRNATINLSTGEVTATGAVPARSTVPTEYENGFRAIVVPQTVSSACSLFSITLGGVAYTYNQGSAFTYQTGKQHNFTVTVNKKTDGGYDVTVQTSISAWTNDNSSHEFVANEYVVVNVETPGTLGETLVAAGKNPDAIKFLKVLGSVNADDFYFMRDNMAILQGVNMQETTLESGSIPEQAFGGKTTLNRFVFPDGFHNNSVVDIQRNAFSGTLLSGALIIPDSVNSIGDSAFSGTKISSLQLSNELTFIGNGAFDRCSGLTGQLLLPNGLKMIGDSAFGGCSNLSGTLQLPSSLEHIGRSAFYGCGGFVGELTIPDLIETIEYGSFSMCGGFTALKLSKNLKAIRSQAFGYSNIKGELVLPQSLVSISSSAFERNSFSHVIFPDSILEIGEFAFRDNTRLSGTIKIPLGVTIIEREAFSGCPNIDSITIPSEIALIGKGAFAGCTNVSSILSYASMPPYTASNAFQGVSKSSCRVEVPESSVSGYIYASGWNEFQHISAHHDFVINRRSFSTLNREESILLHIYAEAGASWSVESKPNWVSVSPSSGIGKRDVTLTVSALASGSGDRTGEVVFLLDGKEYRCTLTVEQYDYAYGDGSVLSELIHSHGSGIPLVFLGDCYDAADIASGSYLSDIEEAINYFFDIEPYRTYKDYFDAYVVFGKSEDSGVGSVDTIRESKFGTQYSLTGGTLENNGSIAFEYAKKAKADIDLTKSLVVVVLNSYDYGGVTYMWNDGSAIALCPKSADPYPYDFRGLVQHEAGGHGFGKLADEYIYTNAFIQACGCPNPHLSEFLAAKANGWYKNLSETSDRDAVPWSHLMYHSTYANSVDIYEGGYFHTRGIFRSEPNSCMNNNIPYYSAISRQAIVERIMEYAGVPFNLDDFYANDVPALGTRAAIERSPYWTPTQSNSSNPKHHQPVIMGDYPNVK